MVFAMEGTMKQGRFYAISALALSLYGLSGCAAEEATSDDKEVGDWGDADKYPQIGGAYSSLTALDGTCAWNATTGAMTVTATANNPQTIIIGARADGVMTVNGALCNATTVTKTALKTIAVAPSGTPASDTGKQVVILDFLNGLFASGAAAGAGVKVNLGGGSADELRIRGTSAADTFTFGVPVVSATVPTGTLGVATGTDTNRDIEALGVEAFAISLGAGADVLSAAGGAATGASSTVFTAPLTVNGGAGNDTITTGTAADTLNGGDGDDTLNGGLGDDVINGNLGNDTVLQGTVADGADDVNCGNETSYVEGVETDNVSYASRTTAVTVTVLALVGVGNDGDGAANAGAGELDDIDTSCEVVTGGSAGDTLTGDATKNTLNGGAGDDTLNGGLADDTLNGGAGNDTFNESAATNGADTFIGGAGMDTVDYSARTMALTVVMDGTANSGATSPAETDTVSVDVENVKGGTLADTITGNASDNVITGGAGVDTLNGGDGNDTFYEGIGGTNGGDTFDGGNGSDTVDYSGRTAAITVTIGAGANDGLAGESDDVTATCENVVGASAFANNLTGDTGNNELTGGSGNDTLNGGAGADILDGGSGGTDTLDCGADDDIAYGSGTVTAPNCEL
jgi:Ca2+-binding RTX toxin-like protein